MHDIKWIRENPAEFDKGLSRRGVAPKSAEVLRLDEENRKKTTLIQELQAKRNEVAKRIGQAKSKGGDAGNELAEAEEIKKRLAALEEEQERGGELASLLEALPNLSDASVPVGKDESANVEIRKWGEPKRFSFQPRQHFEIGEKLGLMDFEQTAKISGARFTTLKGALARMERALASFMLDLHVSEYGYTEVSPPLLVRSAALYGTGQLPKFEEDLFKAGEGYYLIPTSEVPLTNMAAGRIMVEEELPLRLAAYTPCFRSEAGAAGKDTRGMIRQHQFSKVEMVSVTHPDKSEEEHERMTSQAEEVLKRLGLPYRVMLLSSGDMGFSARKTYDLEVWLPGQNAYREISSCSNCGDFQARRMKARFKSAGDKGGRFVHTLNGSGIAIGRTLIAILENYQQEDGSVAVPEVLRGVMGCGVVK